MWNSFHVTDSQLLPQQNSKQIFFILRNILHALHRLSIYCLYKQHKDSFTILPRHARTLTQERTEIPIWNLYLKLKPATNICFMSAVSQCEIVDYIVYSIKRITLLMECNRILLSEKFVSFHKDGKSDLWNITFWIINSNLFVINGTQLM